MHPNKVEVYLADTGQLIGFCDPYDFYGRYFIIAALSLKNVCVFKKSFKWSDNSSLEIPIFKQIYIERSVRYWKRFQPGKEGRKYEYPYYIAESISDAEYLNGWVNLFDPVPGNQALGFTVLRDFYGNDCLVRDEDLMLTLHRESTKIYGYSRQDILKAIYHAKKDGIIK